MFEFHIHGRQNKSRARTGQFVTPHGTLQTPELAIVATEGEVKSIPHDMLKELNIPLLIVNTFHIYTKKILTDVKKLGGIHKYTDTTSVFQSDSGGYQVFSLGFGKAHGLGKIGGMFPGEKNENSDTDNPLTITNEGVTFTFDDARITLDAKRSMDIQHNIGADIIFAFDECTSPLNTYEYVKQSLHRTNTWLTECLKHYKKNAEKQALFGIVQGSYFKDLRMEAVDFLAKQDVPGYGIGGSLGKTKEDMYEILGWILPRLPQEKPRHLLGIGQVRDVFEAVEQGIDLFDCVIPTREARHKVIYTKHGRVSVKKLKLIDKVLESDCGCLTCREKITYKQLAELFHLKDPRAFTFATIHNIYFYNSLMKSIREAIADNRFLELKDEYLKYY